MFCKFTLLEPYKQLYYNILIYRTPLLIVGCNEDKKSTAFDPNQPVKFTEFMPDSGGIRTKFIVKGSNFGEDKSQVKVYFKDEVGNEREALVLGVKPDVIYAQVPKQAGGESHVRVEIAGKEAELSNAEKTFKYIVTSSVSTVVGKAKEGGNKDGTLGETTFNTPRYVAVDNDDNVFIFDSDGRTRLSSIEQNKTITLLDGMVIDQPLFIDKEKKQLFGPCDNANFGCFLFDANVSWVADKMGQLLANGGWMHSVVLDPVDSTFVIYRQNTGQLWTQPFDKNKRTLNPNKAKRIGTLYNVGSNGLCAYNPVDKYVYCVLHSKSAVYRFKLTRDTDGWPALDGDIEEYIPGAGAGFRDGDVQEAQFNEPRGIAIDKEGNLYIADVNNHRIRKVDTKLNIVTTIAGSGKGYKDGDPLEAQFDQPWGVYLDKNEFLYIADQNNHCIRKLAIE
ncbi:NHL domain-containing protein [Bacteroides thetaiotaomicron]|uniref:NHL domain-containing protein n=2 Tax=Bacteroides thetaiotaomicron TaxID=818 RepID=UPI00232BCD65|nr:IPT/TIG domain-containing protein [Bacteroides thetaiotaomicron]MDC2155821.1 IPT/TIG domain-containing protein [Bacteroides thetaiotaomicron]